MKRALLFCLICFLLSRIMVLGVSYATFYSYKTPPAPPGYAETQGPLNRRPLNVLFFYDSVHYLTIADHGYNSLMETAWYPLYPFLIKITGGTAASAVALSNIFFFLGLLALYHLGGKKAVLLGSASPIGIVFSAAYSESLFFALVAWFFVAFKEKKINTAGILAGISVLCRSPGWALAGVLGFQVICGKRKLETSKSFIVAILIGMMFPVYLYCKYKNINVVTFVDYTIFSRKLMPFWWGTVHDVSKLITGSFYPGMIYVVILNLFGWLWIMASLIEPDFLIAGIIYSLFVLSFPITNPNYVHATFSLLRYACVWPASYLGLSKILKTRITFIISMIGFSAIAVAVSVLVACKAFIF